MHFVPIVGTATVGVDSKGEKAAIFDSDGRDLPGMGDILVCTLVMYFGQDVISLKSERGATAKFSGRGYLI